MRIGRADVLWNFAATFLRITASILLYPLILRMMTPEKVGVWTIFLTITSLVTLLDFGFNPSFTRNITYVLSGVKSLKPKGFSAPEDHNESIDYGLLKGVVKSMQWFYSRIAILLFILLITLGTYYIFTILKTYKGDQTEVYIAWGILCVITTYSLYTLYYDSLLQGSGMIKRSKQINIIGQLVYLLLASLLILAGFGLVAIVFSQASSVMIIRYLSYRSFFTAELKHNLHSAEARPRKEVLAAIYPNALKLGLTSLGGILVSRSAIVIGSLYLTLENIAAYGISIHLIMVISTLAATYIYTFQPKIAQLRVENNEEEIKKIYVKGALILFFVFALGGIGLVLTGEWVLRVIGSQTQLMPRVMVAVALLVYYLEMNHGVAGSILASKNEVPYFKAALVAGGITVLLLLGFFKFTPMGLWAMIAAPGIAQGIYQNWKWPVTVAKELKISYRDIKNGVLAIIEIILTRIKVYKSFLQHTR